MIKVFRCILYGAFSLLFLSGCSNAPVKNTADDAEHTKKMIEYLFEADTLSSHLRNDANFHTIEIKQMKFVPETLKVHPGDTVAWINNDMVTHDITEEKSKAWSSSPLPAGATWKTPILKTTDYFCSIHVVMKGKIVIE